MNTAITRLIEHIATRPTPPMTPTKTEYVKFRGAYSQWLIKLDQLRTEVEKGNKHYSQLTREEAEQQAKEAEAVLRAEYWQAVRFLAEDIKDELKERLERGESGEPLREWLIEYVDVIVDSSDRVIYTWQAKKVLIFSDNASDYVDTFGDEGLVDGGDIAWSAMAWAAMRQDVIEQLEAEGIDYNEPDSEATREALGLATDEDEDNE